MKSQTNYTIIKESGEQELFDFGKLVRSLRRSGADEDLVQVIVDKVKRNFNYTTAGEVYSAVYKALKDHKKFGVAGRYRLKKALKQLGPSGYPFEKFVAEIFVLEGYDVKLNQIISGHCVDHELDLVIEDKQKQAMVECKFHQRTRLKSDIKIALYVKARFDDVEKKWRQDHEDAKEHHEAWIVTNTSFTTQVIKYSLCAGVKLISWSYPEKGSLAELIDTHKLHPITVLSSMSQRHKDMLLKKGFVLCRQVADKRHILKSAGLKEAKIDEVIAEAVSVCELK